VNHLISLYLPFLALVWILSLPSQRWALEQAISAIVIGDTAETLELDGMEGPCIGIDALASSIWNLGGPEQGASLASAYIDIL
jgi:hypothetical protein